ncbi:MAG: nucleotidyltransferase domain-containing protein [Lysobacterales bacterium]
MSVAEAIQRAIADIERDQDVRILFAAESGSRAWGFASPDSDYDVRFIYVHRRDWYIRIDEPRDVIEAMLPGDLDLSGWDLRKTLNLFLRCNLALNEWLGSPIVYAERGDLAQRLRTLISAAFRAQAGYHHYLSMARGVYNSHVAADPVRLKKVFYVLRPLLACRWIEQTGSQPPTEFSRLTAADWVSDVERSMIGDLATAKAESREGDETPLDEPARRWLIAELDRAETAKDSIRSSATLGARELNEILRECTRTAWQ